MFRRNARNIFWDLGLAALVAFALTVVLAGTPAKVTGGAAPATPAATAATPAKTTAPATPAKTTTGKTAKSAAAPKAGAKITGGAPGTNRIQLAILLDTSNSMDGLIDQAKSQLWNIVNELSRMKRNGVSPALEVALYEYGNDRIPAGEGHIRCVSSLTTDLDLISEKLFALTTNGGYEFCGQVIGAALSGLQWSADPDDLRLVYIAGNEPFTQGSVDYRPVCARAAGKGIVVSTIFCGSSREGIEGKWKDGADAGGGKFMCIDQNKKAAVITTPQDAEIARLGQELNQTYLAYGVKGAESKTRQEAQDANAASVGGAVTAQRAVAKASTAYNNASWDLVDAKKEGKVDVEKLKEEEMPAEMQKMTPAEREKYVEGKRRQREEIQAKIRKLQAERDQYIATQRKGNAARDTLDEVILESTREAAGQRGYK
ncbi:MAG: VWA domain-containing protein [Acidobacteria bacterium]|nr:VWA domain-containing protein [Acidobacteriota bacterium]